MAYYRIINDTCLGFKVQVFRWWWPFWIEAGFCNTHSTIERAEKFAEGRARKTVKYLGKFSVKENKV